MLPVAIIERLERLLGGDPATEEAILAFISHKYNARSLADLAEETSREIFRRPYDFVRTARAYHTPELNF